jgi:Notch-like protein
MYVIREMEDAIMDCKSGCIKCNDDPVHAWDEAVAFYAGSLEGEVGDTSGVLLHQLADKRCSNFGTCSGTSGGSAVNAAIFKEFQNGQFKLQSGECDKVAPIKKRIVELMSVPLVQGSLRYAYKVEKLQGGSTEIAEGAAFSAAILPRVHACNAAAAKTISDSMNMESSSPMAAGFISVKKAFESTYACLGITCEDVGGLLKGTEYYEFAEPCGTSAKAPAPEPAPEPAPAPAPDGHDDHHDHDDHDDHDDHTTPAATTSGGASLQPGAALLLGALLLAHRGIQHQVF